MFLLPIIYFIFTESDGVDSVIVVDGIPVVDAAKQEKLKAVIRKIYQKYGKIVTEHYPVDGDGNTKGYMFLEFSRHQVMIFYIFKIVLNF